MKDDQVYIRHVHDAIGKIEEYLNEIKYEQYVNDSMRIDAVVRELEIIGEAINNISEEFKNSHKNMPWREVIGMRNKLIHEYFGVDIDVVWQTCQKDLPVLKELINEMLK